MIDFPDIPAMEILAALLPQARRFTLASPWLGDEVQELLQRYPRPGEIITLPATLEIFKNAGGLPAGIKVFTGPIHAKLLIVELPSGSVAVFGSENFTRRQFQELVAWTTHPQILFELQKILKRLQDATERRI